MNPAQPTYDPASQDAAYELLPCGVVRTDKKHRIRYINSFLLDLLGFEGEALIGQRRFNELLSVGGKIFFETHHATILDLEGEIYDLTYDMVGVDRTRYPVLVNAKRLPGNSTEEGFVYTITPFVDHRSHERALVAARKEAEMDALAKKTFISTISHEIRTPLHAILEAGNWLMKGNPRQDQLELVTVLRSAGHSLLGVVNEILDISKLESGKTTFDARPFYVHQLLDELRLTFSHRCASKGLELIFSGNTELLPPLLGDRVKISQVLNNLLSNAIKFTDIGEIRVSIEASVKGSLYELHFTVQDTGIGIPIDRQVAIFEPFTQASASTTTQYGGTGLGLAIAKRIVEAYGSRLELESRVGEGTSFEFTLQLPTASPGAEGQPDSTLADIEGLPPLNHLHVVNVDDNAANLLINKRYFDKWKLGYEQFATAEAALREMEADPVDLVLLDLQMPIMDGYELARRIRASDNQRVAQMPLIALSASNSEETNTNMLAAGINGMVLKPFDPIYLYHVIRRYGELNGKRNFSLVQPEIETPADDPEAYATSSPDSSLPPIDAAIDYSGVQDIFAGDDSEYRAFLEVVGKDLADILSRLSDISNDYDVDKLAAVHHNLLSTTRVFQLTAVREQVSAAREALKNEDKARFALLMDWLQARLTFFQADVIRKSKV